jgi:hypothetical protein
MLPFKFNTGDCLIEMTAWADLNVLRINLFWCKFNIHYYNWAFGHQILNVFKKKGSHDEHRSSGPRPVKLCFGPVNFSVFFRYIYIK